MMLVKIGSGWVMLFSLLSLNAQLLPKINSEFSQDPLEWYDQVIGMQNTILQNGELAVLERKSTNSHAYYQQSTWTNIDLTYYGQTFSSVPALYNIEQDNLIIKNTLGPSFSPFPVHLNDEFVSEFRFGSAHFVFIADEIDWRTSGFYKLIYDGDEVQLLSKVFKELEVIDGLPSYTIKNYYYVREQGNYHRLKRLNTLTRLYPEHKRGIRKQKRELSIRNLDHPKYESELKELIRYCDNLLKVNAHE